MIRDGAGAVALTKLGVGTQILTGNNTYSGATTISAGKLQIGVGGVTGRLGTGAVSMAAGTTLEFNLGESVMVPRITFSDVLSGSGNIVKTGVGTVILNGNASTFSGGTINGETQVGEGGTLDFTEATEKTVENSVALGANSILRVTLSSEAIPIDQLGSTTEITINGNLTLGADMTLEIVMEAPMPDDATYHLFGANGILGETVATNFASLTIYAPHTTYYFTDSADIADYITMDAASNHINLMLHNMSVPEPSTWLLLILGAVGLHLYRRRRK